MFFFQNLFAFSLQKQIQLDITTFYIKHDQDELDFSNQLKNILTEIPLTVNFILSILYIITELLLIIAILTSLFIVELESTLIISLFFIISGFIVFKLIKWKSFAWGQIREKLDLEIFSKISEILDGKKEINLYNKTDNFILRIDELLFQKKKLMAKNATLGQFPKYAIELIAIIAIMIFLATKIIYQGEELKSILAISGILLVGIFKLLPSINKVLNHYNTLKFNSKSFQIIYETKVKSLKEEVKKKPVKNFKNVLKLKNLTFRFKNKLIFNDASFEIIKNKKTGIYGGSGLGKSTLINILIRNITPESCNIQIDNLSYNIKDVDIKSLFSVMFQDAFIFSGTIEENITLKQFKKFKTSKAITKILSNDLMKRTFDDRISEKGSNLSGGQKQRISIARSIYMNREILIFDEPSNSLSEENIEYFKEFLMSTNKTVIIVSHNKNIIDLCDRVYELKNKKLILQ